MLISMRTTLIIDDHVAREAKRQALEAGLNLSEFTTLALREVLRKADQKPERRGFVMPVYGEGSHRAPSPSALAELRDDGR